MVGRGTVVAFTRLSQILDMTAQQGEILDVHNQLLAC